MNAEEILGMVRHWLSTHPGSYLGSSYGFPGKDLLQQPLSGGADIIIAKMLEDIPVLRGVERGAISLEMEQTGIDTTRLLINIAGHTVEIA